VIGSILYFAAFLFSARAHCFLCFDSFFLSFCSTCNEQESYLAQGGDPQRGPDWYYYHLRMCFDTHKAANKCVIDHREQELKERQKRIREKRLGMVHV